jgi:hypothetical protein
MDENHSVATGASPSSGAIGGAAGTPSSLLAIGENLSTPLSQQGVGIGGIKSGGVRSSGLRASGGAGGAGGGGGGDESSAGYLTTDDESVNGTSSSGAHNRGKHRRHNRGRLQVLSNATGNSPPGSISKAASLAGAAIVAESGDEGASVHPSGDNTKLGGEEAEDKASAAGAAGSSSAVAGSKAPAAAAGKSTKSSRVASTKVKNAAAAAAQAALQAAALAGPVPSNAGPWGPELDHWYV